MEQKAVIGEGSATARNGRVRRRWKGGLGAAALLATMAPVLAASAEWTPVTPAMAARRYAPTATLVSGPSANAGKVLVAGGYTGGQTTYSAQLFNSSASSGTSPWVTTGSLRTARAFHTATDLGDDTGRVLLAGGFTSSTFGWQSLRSLEIYDPSTGAFNYASRTEIQYVKQKGKLVAKQTTVQVNMNDPRELFTATLLPLDPVTGSRKILLAGGVHAGRYTLATAELFDPKNGTIEYTGPMIDARGRHEHDAVLIPPVEGTADQGKVLIVGGKAIDSNTGASTTLQTAELYDIATGTFTSIPMLKPRTRPRVAWVPGVGTRGMALVVGGKSENPEDPAAPRGDILDCEWFDPALGAFIPGPSLSQGRMAHTLTAVGDGSLLAAGGWSDTLGRSTETAERFVATSIAPYGYFEPLTYMNSARQDHAAAVLPAPTATGPYRVLVVGGKPNVGGVDSYLSTAEVYTRP